MQEYSEIFNFKIIIESSKVDIQEMEQFTLGLRQELLELNVENVDVVRDKGIPEHAKVVEPISWGVLLIKIVASGGALTMLIKTLERFIMKNQKSSLTLECGDKKLSIKGFITPNERQRIINEWLNTLQK